METKNPDNDPNLAMSTPYSKRYLLPARESDLQTRNMGNLEIAPSQPYQEVKFEEFQRDYDMSPEEAIRHAPSQETARIARNEIANQLHPLMESLNLLKREIASRLDAKIADQNQLLLRIYQNKAFKQAIKDSSFKFDGRDVIKYGPWKQDLKSETRDLVLIASQELQILES